MKASIILLLALVCLVAGCSSPPLERSASSDPAGQASQVLVSRQSEIKDDSVTSFTYRGKNAILISAGGKYYAYVNKCTREGCALAYAGGELKCPCCGSVFDITNGAPLSGPAKIPLAGLQVSINDGDVYALGQ